MSGAVGKLCAKVLQGFKHPFRSYKNALENHPILVQSIQTGILYGCSDILAQTFVEKTSLRDIHIKRTLLFVTTGAIYTGPVASIWIRFLGRNFTSTGRWTAVKKMGADQFAYAPFFHLGLITVVNTLHGHDSKFIKRQIELKYIDIMKASVTVWPVISFFNFSYTPLNYQVLVGQVVALFWNVYVSWKTQQGIQRQKDSSKDFHISHPVGISQIKSSN